MKKTPLLSLLSVLIFLISFGNYSSAQTKIAGKIVSKNEADQLFGPVLESLQMNTSDFESLINKCEDYMLFSFEPASLNIFNKYRSLLFRNGSTREFSMTDKMKMYSVSVIKELLAKGQATKIVIERRQEVLSITDGSYTMEYAAICPPDCPN